MSHQLPPSLKGNSGLSTFSLACLKLGQSTVHLISELLCLALNAYFAVKSSSKSLPTTEDS